MVEFEFNGRSSDEFGVIVTTIEENNELESRSLILGQKNKYRARENHFGTTYDKNYSFNITFIKDICKRDYLPWVEDKIIDGVEYNNVLVFHDTPTIDPKTHVLTFPSSYDLAVSNGNLISQHSDYFTSNDIKALNAWLTSPQFPKLLRLKNKNTTNDDYYFEDVDFFGTITAVNVENIGKPYQITYTVTCDSPYGYSPEKKVWQSSTKNNPTSFTINNTSDCQEEYIYPLIKFNPIEEYRGEIRLLNITDNNRELILNTKDIINKITFYMDCQNFKLYADDQEISFKELGITSETINNIYWPRLCYGINEFVIQGDMSVEITYREPRKVGVFI